MSADLVATQLATRYALLDECLGTLEKLYTLTLRYKDIFGNIRGVRSRLMGSYEGHASTVGQHPVGQAESHGVTPVDALALPADASEVYQRLVRELDRLNLSSYSLVRVPADYYDQDLEYRRQCLGAASTCHLCKSIIMKNTKVHPSAVGKLDPVNPEYVLVIVQYTGAINAEKIEKFLHRQNGGKVGRQYFKMRLAPGEESDELSGYVHNAVSPVGIKTQVPIILSESITRLSPDIFFLGAGEVDLKLGMHVQDFIKAYHPHVVNID